MKKFALLSLLALSLSGFAIGCSEAPKKPAATPAATEGDKKPPMEGETKPDAPKEEPTK